MIVVADSGPLIAFAKIGGLETLFSVYPQILTPPAVYEETIMQGRYAEAPDAALLRAEYELGRLRVESSGSSATQLSTPLGRGELEAIHLALERKADWLLIDDLDARHAAIEVFERLRARSGVKGTLGIIASAYLEGLIPLNRANHLLDAIRFRKDIWVSPALCKQVQDALLRPGPG